MASSSPAQDHAPQAGGGECSGGGGDSTGRQVPAPAFSWDGAGMPKSKSAKGLVPGCLWEGSAAWKSTHTPALLVKFPAKDEDVTNSEPWFHTCDLLTLPRDPARWPLLSCFTDGRSEAYRQGYVISPMPHIGQLAESVFDPSLYDCK